MSLAPRGQWDGLHFLTIPYPLHFLSRVLVSIISVLFFLFLILVSNGHLQTRPSFPKTTTPGLECLCSYHCLACSRLCSWQSSLCGHYAVLPCRLSSYCFWARFLHSDTKCAIVTSRSPQSLLNQVFYLSMKCLINLALIACS